MSMEQLSKRLKISQPTASQSANRGEKIAKENKLKLLQNNQLIKERSLSPHGQCPIVLNHSVFEIVLRPYKEEVISA